MSSRPRLVDRVLDALALLVLLGGIGLFLVARRALTGIGDGTYVMPEGVSAVVQTDIHVAQSRLALVVIGIGVMLGVAAAIRHKLR